MKAYYDRRAAEYDDWWLGTGLHADRDRPGWHEEVEALICALEALPPVRTLDVACGTGFLTQHLSGQVVGLDQSESMLEIARARVPAASFVRGDGVELPFPTRPSIASSPATSTATSRRRTGGGSSPRRGG